ncbi:hypothetical protein AB0I81_52875 [Nonomuraea sp. NPDC050404]|uniref:hypothetical protein n=1 Tax=Nonomuraea sp. NPDC050404 TaxID=3155783 RepID=UPI0033EB7D2B
MTIGEIGATYSPRQLVFFPWKEVRGWRVKRYGISATRPEPPRHVVLAGDSAAGLSLPEPYDGALSCAFSVVHEDEDGCYALVAWWSRNGLILHTRTWISGWDAPGAWTPAPACATACVWELVAVCHERRSWVEHVLRPDAPDVRAYLGSGVNGAF